MPHASAQMHTPELTIQGVVEVPLGLHQTKVMFHSFDKFKPPEEHVLVTFGTLEEGSPPLVRIHSECLTGDVFGSSRCDCGPQLTGAIDLLVREGGCLIYLRQEGRGIGLYAKLQAYRLQDEGLNTFEANRHLGFRDDQRSYWPAVAMLRAINISSVRLITNNPDKLRQLEAHGIRIVERIGTPTYETPHNRKYLEAKVAHAQHFLHIS